MQKRIFFLVFLTIFLYVSFPILSESNSVRTGTEVEVDTNMGTEDQNNQDYFFLAFTGLGHFGLHRFKPGVISDEVRGELAYSNGFFNFLIDFSLLGDKKYRPHSVYELDHYFLMNNSVIGFSLNELSLTGGRGLHRDIVDTPYSIYISSHDNPAVFLDFTWDSERFLYETRWVRLNARSMNTYTGYPDMNYFDRGMTYKVYALKMGDLRFGYQDSCVYLFRAFDFETFMNPLPMFFLQMITTTSGRPWSETDNTNSLMGFFFDITKPDWYIASQILVDDINATLLKYILGDLIPALNNINNLSKVAWSLGGYYQLPFGKIGFYHGGATKHTFPATYVIQNRNAVDSTDERPYYSRLPYEYCYYPATTFLSSGDGGSEIEIPYIENYIGYKYGENNLAFLVNYTNTFLSNTPWTFDLYTSLEYVISGSKSPANPWHKYDSWVEIEPLVELLNEDILEHTLALIVNLEKRYGPWVFSLSGELGYLWNELKLTSVPGRPDEPKIWKPTASQNRALAALTLGIRYQIDF